MDIETVVEYSYYASAFINGDESGINIDDDPEIDADYEDAVRYLDEEFGDYDVVDIMCSCCDYEYDEDWAERDVEDCRGWIDPRFGTPDRQFWWNSNVRVPSGRRCDLRSREKVTLYNETIHGSQ